MRFEYCESSRNSLVFLEQFKDTLVDNWVTSLLNTIGKSLCFTEAVFLNLSSKLETGLIAKGIESKEGRHAIFFTLLNPFWRCSGRRLLEKLSRAQVHGLRFWQTKSNAIIVHNLVLTDSIYMITSQNEIEQFTKDAEHLDLRQG